MSIDVYLTLPNCAHCGSEGQEVYDRGQTYNTMPMLYMAAGDALKGDLRFTEFINGKTAAETLPLLQRINAFLQDAANHEALYAKTPSNGWGSLDGMKAFVAGMLESATKYPKAIWRAN